MPEIRLANCRDNYICPYCGGSLMDGKHTYSRIKDFPIIGCPSYSDVIPIRLVNYQDFKELYKKENLNGEFREDESSK